MPEKPPPRPTPTGPGTGKGSVTYLDQTLWRKIAEAESDEEFYHVWLTLQARMIGGVSRSVLVLGAPGTGPFAPAAVWPDDEEGPKNLAGILDRVFKELKGVVSRKEGEEGEQSEDADIHLAYPVWIDGKLHGAAAFEISARSQDRLEPIMRQIQWGLAWVRSRILSRETHRDTRVNVRVTTALDMAAVTLQEAGFKGAASSLTTQLASRLACDRVSLGFVKGKQVRVRALSHSAQFKKQMNLIRAIESAMTESLDQASPIVYHGDAERGRHVMRAHAGLAEQAGDGAICTVPFQDSEGRAYGALTLERSSKRPFEEGEVELCDTVAALVGPILEEKRRNDRWLIFKAGDSFRSTATKVLGPGHLAAKMISAAALAVLLFSTFAKGEYRVTARTVIEGSVQRAVVAPYDGFIHEAFARAGDTVRKGEILCTLDERDMRLERVRLESQREQLLRQYREAMAEGNRANVRIVREQISQAEAQMTLLDEQLSRARMTAPFDGIVVTGDLSQSLGSPVQRGQVLFEVAPLEEYRLKLRVDEREIEQVRVGQKGTLILNSLPEEPMPMTVEKITPVSVAEEGKNYFLVEAGLDPPAAPVKDYSITVTVNDGERKQEPPSTDPPENQDAPRVSGVSVTPVDDRGTVTVTGTILDPGNRDRLELVVDWGDGSPAQAFVYRVDSTGAGTAFSETHRYLDEVSERLRPGMEGFGKISVDRRRLIWIWTHDLVDWVRLWLWSWLP